MARSTKLEKLITDPLNTRLTTAEGKVSAIETRSLVDEGDNVSLLTNDVGYQNATQVDTKIQAVVGAAPAALDTLQEIADALADDDDAIAALIAQDTANSTAIALLQTNNHKAATSGNAAIEIDANQEIKLKVSESPDNLATVDDDGLFVVNQGVTKVSVSQTDSLYYDEYEGIKHLVFHNVNHTVENNDTLYVSDRGIYIESIDTNNNTVIALATAKKLEFINTDIQIDGAGSTSKILPRNATTNSSGLLSAVDKIKLDSINAQANKIRRLSLTTDITLTNVDAEVQNLINTTAGDRTINLPSSPFIGLSFEVINHSSSTKNLLFAGEAITPGNRHAVQWDSVEWVVM